MTRPQTLPELLTEYRDRSGDSYAVIADRCGISKARAYQLTTGRIGSQNPPHETLLKISSGLGIPMAALLAGVGRGGESAHREQVVAQVLGHLDHMGDDTLSMAEAVLAAMASRDRRDRS